MRNRYPGICYRCGKLVEKDKGHFEKIEYKRGEWRPGAPKWRTQHADCCIESREKKYAPPAAQPGEKH